MFTVPDVSQNGQNSGSNVSQQTVIASVVAQQKVIAAQRGNASGDTGRDSMPDQAGREKALRANEEAAKRRSEDKRADAKAQEEATNAAKSSEARSIVEAQEASAAEAKVTAAYIGRHSFTDLLSVIRDPEDRVLPKEPANLSG